MAKGDYRIDEGPSIVRKWLVDDQTNSTLTRVMYAGEPVQLGSVDDTPAVGSQYIIPILTGDPEIGTNWFVGVLVEDDDSTSSAEGSANVAIAIPSTTVLTAKATTAANVDTQAELDAYLGDTVCATVTSLVYTINENEGEDDNVHGFVIIGGNIKTKEVDFVVKPLASFLGSNVS